MYKMEINISGQQRIFLFRGPGCRKTMLQWCRDQLGSGEDIRSIRVLGTVGNKYDVVLEWPQDGPPAAEEHNPSSARGLDAGHEGSRHSRASGSCTT
jgi:hypothetical protein